MEALIMVFAVKNDRIKFVLSLASLSLSVKLSMQLLGRSTFLRYKTET